MSSGQHREGASPAGAATKIHAGLIARIEGEVVKYSVSIPITGFCAVEVEAENSKSAIAAAWKAIDDGCDGDVEWEAMQNGIEVTRLRDDEAAQVSSPAPKGKP